jgi:hypothetical protein
MTEELLWDYLRSTVPADAASIVEAAIRAVGRLPDMGTWKPSTLHWYETTNVVTWGIPLALTEVLPSLHQLRKQIGASIANKGEPDSADLAEVDVAALLLESQAQRVEHVTKVNKARTPDYHAQWGDSQLIEVEVTRADRKPGHKAREKIADCICNDIAALHHPWDVVAYIADDLSEAEVKVLLETARSMSPDGYFNCPDKWWLFAETINRPPRMIDFSRFNHSLRGWPLHTVPGGVIIWQIPDSLESTVANPQVCVGYGVPVSAYINPVEHKATRKQGANTNPFVIAVDIDMLPRGYSEFQRVLPTYLEAWPTVSAILLFRRERLTDKFGWTWELHLNPKAQYSFPSAMLQHFPREGQRYEVYWKYTTSDLV